VPPGKALCDQLLGGEALHELDDLEVGHSRDLGVLLQVEVLLRIEDTLCSSTACLLDAYRTGDGMRPCASCNEIQYYAEGTQKLWADIQMGGRRHCTSSHQWFLAHACFRTQRIWHQTHGSSMIMQPACFRKRPLTLEEVLVHLLAVLLWDEHDCWGRSLSASARGQLDSL
jgi:hypothetical protein